MTQEQANERIEHIGRMWPGAAQRMTTEECESWRRVMIGHETGDVDAALRHLRDTLTVWPTPGHLRARLAGTARPGPYRFRAPEGVISYRQWLERRGLPSQTNQHTAS